CIDLPMRGYKLLAEVSVDTAYTTSAPSTSGMVAVCPFKNNIPGRYFGRPVSDEYGGTTGGNQATALRIAIPTLSAGEGACLPIRVHGVNAGNWAHIQNAVSVDLTGGSGAFYSSGDCSGGTATSTGLALGGGGGNPQEINLFYLVPSGANVGVTADDTTNALTDDTKTITIASATVPTKFILAAPPNAKKYECIPVTLGVADASSNWQVAGGVGYAGITVSPSSGTGSFHYTGDCSDAPLASMAAGFASTDTTSTFFFMPTGATNVTLSADDGGGGLAVSAGLTVNVAQPGAAAYVGVNAPSTMNSGTCYTVDISILDSNYATTAWSGANENVTLPGHFSGAWYGNNTDCGSSVSPVGSVTFVPTEFRKRVWFKPGASGNGQFTVTPATLTMGDAPYVTVP
ncbi:MAG TPA: hypothetical protein VFV50_18965, partial [Bdellovibrionales bacterium]|nr:hypothetical protein [Bdellovibrionales bacterium]